MQKKMFFLLMTLLFGSSAFSQKLPKFESTICKQVGPKSICTPYTSVTSYLGYAAPNTEDEVKDGKKFYYIYVWVPIAAPEFGVRMISPVGKTEVKDATVSTDFETNKASTEFFDTYITLERCITCVKEDDVTPAKVKSGEWVTLERNDDNSDLPAQPSGSKYNSLLQYVSKASDPKGALTIGLYRIGFTTYKTGEVKGTFLAQVGAPIDIPGIVVGRLDKVMEALKNN